MVGQVVTAGLDKKIMFWDIRMGRASGNLDADVASMSLSGYDLIVAVGASVNMYDLRYLGRSVQSSELRMDVQIKCVSSNPYSRGIKNVGSHLCMSHLYQLCMSDSDFKHALWCSRFPDFQIRFVILMLQSHQIFLIYSITYWGIHVLAGHVVGSIDGRVAVEISHSSDSNNPGSVFNWYFFKSCFISYKGRTWFSSNCLIYL